MLIFRRFKLWRVERATGIRLLEWQRNYVLHKTDHIVNYGRQRGKTIAVIFEILVWRKEPVYEKKWYKEHYISPMSADMDYCKNKNWHEKELYKYWKVCKQHHIKVFKYV